MILWRCKNTSGIFCECAWWAVGIIEIQNNFASFDRLSVIISAWRICLFATGQILEFDEQFVIFNLCDLEFIGLAFEPKRDVSIHAVFDLVAKGIWLV